MGRALSFALAWLMVSSATAAVRRVLYVTNTAGYRHDSIAASVEVMRDVASQSGALEVVHTEDLSYITAGRLRDFDAIYFFTSGELALSNQQKLDLLDFVRQGKGFGGSHSATDTFYTWPEYGELIGGIFDGHPWVTEATYDIEDPENPIVAHVAPKFRAWEEIYKFRSFSRDRVRVLVTLDTRSVGASETDVPLVWIRKYGNGRVFYSAFGHFDDSYRLPVFRTMLLKALLWLTGEIEVDATPKTAAPAVTVSGNAFAPGGLIAITGERLTAGVSQDVTSFPLPPRLAGTHVEVNGLPAPVFFTKPGSILAQLPYALVPGQSATLTVTSVGRLSNAVPLRIVSSAPSLVAETRAGSIAILYAIGLGTTQPAVPEGTAAPLGSLARTTVQPVVRIGGQPAAIEFSGLAPGYAGLYQVNAVIPPGATGPIEITAPD